MSSRISLMRPVAAFILAAVTMATSVQAENDLAVETVPTDWLVTGPLWVPGPALSDKDNRIADAMKACFLDLDNLEPSTGRALEWYPGVECVWKREEAVDGRLTFSVVEGREGQVYVTYAATYVEASRWQEVTLKVESDQPVALYVDGIFKEQSSLGENRAGLSVTEALHRGKHLLLLKTAVIADTLPISWETKVRVEGVELLSSSVNPRRGLTCFSDYALFDRVSQIALSNDGRLAAFVHSHRDKEYKRHSHIEVYDLRTNRLLHTIMMAKNVRSPFFLPAGKQLAFRMAEDEGTSVWMFDLETTETERVLKPTKGLRDCVPSPDAKFLYYSADPEKKPPHERYTLLSELEERLTDWTDTRRISVISLEDATTHDLTGVGEFALDEFALSYEGDKLIFTRRLPVAGRPYFSTEFWLADLSSGETQLLLAQPIAFETRPLNLTWLPDGNYVAYTAASHLTEEDETISHNVSEVDIYLLDTKRRQTANLSGDTPFTVAEGSGLHWNPRDKHLYFVAMVRGFAKVYKVDPLRGVEFREVPLPFPYVESLELADDGSVFTFTASSPDHPSAAYAYDLKKRRWWELADPTAELMEKTRLASWERWDFVNSDSLLIDGWIYYPPDFSPEKRWPLVVYFYAGVWPQEENFYFTFHWWAANGYVVYALTPVGAIGFGDDFSDKHVNDWGELATRDVIEGTEKLLREKAFIDPERVGAYGGSYGGFTTMDLITKTDLFAAAISMYGISNIGSYWGGGIWGYTYGDIALARSFPWNRRDIFVDKSPLYHADKINTPLLLLHGLDDANVPPLESEQMFTALKVQGKEVAYVRFPGEDHGIAGNFENYIDHREMMLEWFDKYLKGQPEAWEARCRIQSGE